MHLLQQGHTCSIKATPPNPSKPFKQFYCLVTKHQTHEPEGAILLQTTQWERLAS